MFIIHIQSPNYFASCYFRKTYPNPYAISHRFTLLFIYTFDVMGLTLEIHCNYSMSQEKNDILN